MLRNVCYTLINKRIYLRMTAYDELYIFSREIII